MAKVPTTTHQQQAVRVVKGKPVFYDTPEVKAARAKLTAHLAKHRPEEPLRGAVRLLVKWCFPRGKSHRDGEYRITRPDTDNLQKLLKDCMTAAGFWKDDAQVASEICEKFWADISGLYISAEEIGGNSCFDCPACDEDLGCTLPPFNRSYACPLEAGEELEHLCGTCNWHDDSSYVCMNAGSHFGGEVTKCDYECSEWERKKTAAIRP